MANYTRPILFVLLLLGAASAFVAAPKHRQQRTIACSLHNNNADDDSSTTAGLSLQSRRAFFNKGGGIITMAAIIASQSAKPAMAAATAEEDATVITATAEEEGLVDVYFGCGCFWHVQHEMVEAEKKILGRTDDQLTARAGYAGGKAGASSDGKVCYHNAANIADYGKLGHAEVVGLRIPPSKFKDFCVEYFQLFDKDGNRPDQGGDRGTEYRSLVGFPGGSKSEFAKILVDASIASGDKLDFAVGKGDDKDVRKVSFLMDTADYPFFVGEQYHQFHDGFNLGENYPGSYNNLADKFAKSGESFGNCPNGSFGIGIGGL
jgi:peptide methionine sulfoxide reductase MsrA